MTDAGLHHDQLRPTGSGPTLTKMGEVTSDLSFFRDVPDDLGVTVAVAVA